MLKAETGIIGGSAIYQIEGAEVIEELDIDTPWGKPSDKISIVNIDGHTAAFLPRHGRGHVFLPSEVNFRANIAALKMIGVREIIAFSAVGSLKKEIKIRDFIVPDQIIDRTKNRPSTFFGEGIAAHISFGTPFCSRISETASTVIRSIGLSCHNNETLICMEGPAFSTKAESRMYRSWGAGIINMSVLPEAKLAREAGICYCMICMCTDYDCWYEPVEEVSSSMVVENLQENARNAQLIIKKILPLLGKERTCGCRNAAASAVLTAQDKWPAEKKKALSAVLPEFFG